MTRQVANITFLFPGSALGVSAFWNSVPPRLGPRRRRRDTLAVLIPFRRLCGGGFSGPGRLSHWRTRPDKGLPCTARNGMPSASCRAED